MKNKANKCKMLINYIHDFSIAKSANLYQILENHVWKFRFCSSFFFLSFFLSFFFLSSSFDKLNSKTVVCMWVLNIPNGWSATVHLPFLVLGGVRATTGELRPQNCSQRCFACSIIDFWGVDFWGFSSIIPDVAHIVRPHPDYWNERMQLWVSRSSTIHVHVGFSIYLALKNSSVHLKTLLCIWIRFGCPECDSTHFGGKQLWLYNHLDINSSWKLLVASCVCVCGWSLIARFQHVRFQH